MEQMNMDEMMKSLQITNADMNKYNLCNVDLGDNGGYGIIWGGDSNAVPNWQHLGASTGSGKELIQPNQGSFYPSSEPANSITDFFSSYIGGKSEKEKIFEIIEKIIAGGKKQLIFSVKSEDELEVEVAKMLIKLAGSWSSAQRKAEDKK